MLDVFPTKHKYRPIGWVTIVVYFQIFDFFFLTKIRYIQLHQYRLQNLISSIPNWFHINNQYASGFYMIFAWIYGTVRSSKYAGLSKRSVVTGLFKTHWGRVTHIYVSKITIIGSDNGLSPGRCQAIIWTSVGILLIGPLGTNFSEILIEIYTFSIKKMHLKMSSGKWWPFCLGLNVLRITCIHSSIILYSSVSPVYIHVYQ